MSKQARVGILTVSDRGAAGVYEDRSGPVIRQLILNKLGAAVVCAAVVPDEQDIIKARLIEWVEEQRLDLILTTGGTGFAPRDVTPEATRAVIQKETNSFLFK